MYSYPIQLDAVYSIQLNRIGVGKLLFVLLGVVFSIFVSCVGGQLLIKNYLGLYANITRLVAIATGCLCMYIQSTYTVVYCF